MPEKLDRRELMALTAGAGIVTAGLVPAVGADSSSAVTAFTGTWEEFDWRGNDTKCNAFIDMLQSCDTRYTMMTLDKLKAWCGRHSGLTKTVEIHTVNSGRFVQYGFAVSYVATDKGKIDFRLGPIGVRKCGIGQTRVFANDMAWKFHKKFLEIQGTATATNWLLTNQPAAGESTMHRVYCHVESHAAANSKFEFTHLVAGGKHKEYVTISG